MKFCGFIDLIKGECSAYQGSTLIFLAARQSGLFLPDAAGPDQRFTGPDQLFASEVRKCIITWFSVADTKQFHRHFILNIYLLVLNKILTMNMKVVGTR